MVELAPHYYLDNFLRLCDTVEDRYADILSKEERDALHGFRSLSFAARCLYVRLVSRTGPWFRESKLDYPEIGPVGEALDELLETKMIEQAGELDAGDLGQLFTRPELQGAFADRLGAKRRNNKAALLEAIEALGLAGGDMLDAMQGEEPGRIVAPQHLDIIELLQLLFFGNRYQSLTEFVLEDLGIMRYFPYSLERQGRKFESREALQEMVADISRCQDLGVVRAGDPVTQALTILSTIHGFVSLVNDNRIGHLIDKPSSLQDIRDAVLSAIFEGIGARPE